jgi:hypothetical protein
MANSKKKNLSYSSDPNILGSTPKIKIWLTFFLLALVLRFPKTYEQKLRETDFEETGHFQPRYPKGQLICDPLPKLLVWSWVCPED